MIESAMHTHVLYDKSYILGEVFRSILMRELGFILRPLFEDEFTSCSDVVAIIVEQDRNRQH